MIGSKVTDGVAPYGFAVGLTAHESSESPTSDAKQKFKEPLLPPPSKKSEIISPQLVDPKAPKSSVVMTFNPQEQIEIELTTYSDWDSFKEGSFYAISAESSSTDEDQEELLLEDVPLQATPEPEPEPEPKSDLRRRSCWGNLLDEKVPKVSSIPSDEPVEIAETPSKSEKNTRYRSCSPLFDNCIVL